MLPLAHEESWVCSRCRTRLKEPPHPRCSRCHAPRGTGLPADRPCSECADWPPVLIGARASAVMAEPADSLVHGLKYGGWTGLASFMASRMVWEIRGEPLHEGVVVVPVPSTPDRLRERGFNQAELLALGVAEGLDRPLIKGLVRVGSGQTQVALHRSERRANVQGAFRPAESEGEGVRNRSVLLVDDVLTTGATACAAAEALTQAGAIDVLLLTFARALPGAADP
jgi:ComF family protein